MSTTVATPAAPAAPAAVKARRVTPTGVLVLPSTATREEWLAARRNGITATDMVAILGESKYGSALDVYAEKIGAPLVEDDLSEAGEWGVLLEDTVARRWAELNGVTVRRIGLIANIDEPWLMASLDRSVHGCTHPTRDRANGCALEVKTRNAFTLDQWADGATPPGVDVQAKAQLIVSGYDHIHVAALIGGQRLVERVVRLDDDTVVLNYMVAEAAKVWQAVIRRTPPEVDPALLTVDLLNRAHPDRDGLAELFGDAAADARHWHAEYETAGADEKAARERKEAAKVHLLAAMDNGQELLADGVLLATYFQGKPSLTVPADNVRALVADHPDIAAEYVVEKPGTRSFSHKKPKAIKADSAKAVA